MSERLPSSMWYAIVWTRRLVLRGAGLAAVFLLLLISNPADGLSMEPGFRVASCELAADNSTVALWHFNEGSGQTIADASGNGRPLTLGPSSNVEDADPTWSAGAFGAGLFFDSSICEIQSPGCYDADYASGIGSNSFPSNRMTIELWVLPTGGSGSGDSYAQIFTAGFINAFMATDPRSNRIQVGIGDGSDWEILSAYPDRIDLDNGAWHYLAMTYDGSMIKIYADGQLVGSGPATTVLASPGDYKVGGRPSNTFLDGWMDEVRLSDDARTAEMIQTAWQQALPCVPTIFADRFEFGDTLAWSSTIP